MRVEAQSLATTATEAPQRIPNFVEEMTGFLQKHADGKRKFPSYTNRRLGFEAIFRRNGKPQGDLEIKLKRTNDKPITEEELEAFNKQLKQIMPEAHFVRQDVFHD